MSLPPAIFAGSLFGPISTKSLYITGKRFTPQPSATNFSSAARVVDEHDVGVAAAREVERLARAQRDHAHLDAGVLLEHRQQVAEQARLLGRRRRRDDDELLLRACRERGQQEEQRRRGTSDARLTMAVLLRENARPRGSAARGKSARRARARRRGPACRNRISSARRLRLPEVVRDHHDRRAATRGSPRRSRSISLRGAVGSRLAVGSSRNSTSGSKRPRAGEREPLLLAAGEHARRAVGERTEADVARARPATRARAATPRARPSTSSA